MADDYAPVGYYDDEDELARRGYAPAIPVNPAASSPAAPPPDVGYAPVGAPPMGSLEDLEGRAAQPRVAPMVAPDVPPVGSVEDLESRAAQSRVPPVAAGPARPQWKDYAPGGVNNPNPTGVRNFFAHLAGPKFWDAREKAAEANYKNATAEFEAPGKEQQQEALTAEAQARADALRNPPAKPATEPKTPQEVYARAVQQAIEEGRDPTTDPLISKLADTITSIQKPTNEKQNDFEQFYNDWLKDNRFPDTAHNRLLARQAYAAAGQPPQREQQQLAVSPDGTVVELKPGAKVPKGTTTLGSEMKGPTADEQRRADLAQNMNENLDQLEEILDRRPDLFGPFAGRYTGLKEFIGTGDPDVAALKTLEEQMGMAMVGAHAMRNAQHVETAARAVTNSFHNEPKAIKQAIKTARESLATFQQNAGEKPGSSGEKTGGKKEAPEGTRIQVGDQVQVKRNGKWVPE